MQKCFFMLFVLLLPAQVGAGEVPVERRLLVFGDSLSAAFGMAPEEGWVAALAKRLEQLPEPWQVINSSLSGETTAGGAARLAAVLKRHSPKVVILELGGNDGLRGLALQQTRANLDRMIGRIQAHETRVLLLGMRLPPNYGPVFTRRFQALFEDLARERSVAYVPFFLEGVANDPSLMQADGIHPRAVAQARLLDNIWPQLAPVLGLAAQ